MKFLLSTVTLALALAATAAIVPHRFSYRGETQGANSARIESFVYSLYDRKNAEETPTEPLWARIVTTRVEPNGHYSVMLFDDAGNAPTPAMLDAKIADAFAKITGIPEMVVTDLSGKEISRTPMTTLREAQVASTTHAVDVVGVKDRKASMTGNLDIYELYAGALTVGKKTTLPKTCVFAPLKDRFVGGSTNTVIVVKDVQTVREAWPAIVASKREKYENMPCDLVVTYDRPAGGGAYNVIVPFQGTLEVPKTDVQAVAETAFGGL